MNLYLFLASLVVALHLEFIVWVIFGAAWTRRNPFLRWLHIAALAWSVGVEVGPWPCPLTAVEKWLEVRAGLSAYSGGFILHYLDKLVYPNVSPDLLAMSAILLVAANVAIYIQRYRYCRTDRSGEHRLGGNNLP